MADIDRTSSEYRRWTRRPTWELRNMVQALGLHAWRNTPDETLRRAIARDILERRYIHGNAAALDSRRRSICPSAPPACHSNDFQTTPDEIGA